MKTSRARLLRHLVSGSLAGTGVFVLLLAGGVPGSTHDTFVLMGLDSDRAQLAMALVVAAIAAAAAALASGAVPPSILVALAVFGVVFARTFGDETRVALTTQVTQGPFDPIGWTLSAVSLAVVAASLGWAAGTIAAALQGGVLTVVRDARPALGAHRLADRTWLPAVALVVALIVVGEAFSVLGDMLNYSPDVLLHGGGPPGIGLTDTGASTSSPTPGAGAATASPSASPSATAASSWPGPSVPAGATPLVAGPFPGSLVTSGAWSSSRPWTAWLPTGDGSVQTLQFTAPWTGANGATARVDVYLPPGYGTGSRHYPVTYEAPWSIVGWQRSAQVTYQLDWLIDGGAIPAQIVVFAEEGSGPYLFSQCADSANGRAWWDRYLTQTVIPAIDTRFRTISAAAARSLMGSSEGAYCAAMLLARHPDLFAQAASISGYYDAAPRSNQTIGADLVFGGDPGLLAAYSPSVVVRTMAAAVRTRLFFALDGEPIERFYGPYYKSFGTELARLGVPCALVTDAIGHSWIEARTVFGQMMELLAGRMAAMGALTG